MSSILHSRGLRLRHVQLPCQEVLTWPIDHLFHHGSLLPWIISSLQGRSRFGGRVQRPHIWAGFLQDLVLPWKTSTGHFNSWSDIWYLLQPEDDLAPNSLYSRGSVSLWMSNSCRQRRESNSLHKSWTSWPVHQDQPENVWRVLVQY